jgi:hypothetical protein
VLLLAFKYWWATALILAIPASLIVMHVAGLKFGHVACVDCGTKRWMQRVSAEYRCDRCVQQRAAAAAEERRRFNKWSWSPLLNEPMPDGWQPTPAQSGFSPHSPPPPFDPPSPPVFPVDSHDVRRADS